MLARLKARSRSRSRKTMRAAHRLLRRPYLSSTGKTANDLTGQDLAGYVFALHHIRIVPHHAEMYLDAARVTRGPAIHHSA
jgi:hypothetical protein